MVVLALAIVAGLLARAWYVRFVATTLQERAIHSAERIQAGNERQRHERARQTLARVQAIGLAAGPDRVHLLVDREPGPLADAREHLCNLADAANGGALRGRDITVLLGGSASAPRVLGRIRCD